MKPYVLAALVLALAPAARADAIPAPMPLDEVQTALLGCWKQDRFVFSQRMGHAAYMRILCFANDTVSISTLAGIGYSRDFHASAMVGAWTGERAADGTITVTLTQAEGRGTTLTLAPDGADAYVLVDAESSNIEPARITRFVAPDLPPP